MLFVPPSALPFLAKSHSRIPSHNQSTVYMAIPKSVKRSNLLIVGGGPTGSAAAAHLHKRHIPATLIEKQSDFNEFDVTKAYCLRLDYRAGRVLNDVEGMFEHVSADVEPTKGAGMSVTSADGKNMKRGWNRPFQGVPDLCDLRPGVVDSLKRFITGLDGLDARYGMTIKHIQVADDGDMTVTIDSPDGEITHNTRLILACDGRNSKVGTLLEQAQARGEAVDAPYGHGVESFQSPAVGLWLKSAVFNEDVIDNVTGERDTGKFLVRTLSGDPKRGFNDIFRFSVFPATREYRKRVGGVVGTVVRQSGHNIWKLEDVESAYEFFQANFPQTDVRKVISESEMRRFVQATPSKLGDIRRRKSLAVRTGKGGDGGAVVFLGDSAHAFPPDIGQGVCAALGDVGELMKILDNADEEDGLMDVMMIYDDIRSDEGKALMKISRFGSPYQYMVYMSGFKVWSLNYMMRRWLSKLFPAMFWPQISTMISEDVSYREIVRRGDVTTRRLFGASVVLVAMVATLVTYIM